MKNSGLVSVGHLVAPKYMDEYKLTFRHFCTVLACNLSEDMIHKSAAHWMFDQVTICIIKLDQSAL